MKTILQLKKLVIIPLLFLAGNVWGQKILPNFTDYDQVGQSWSYTPLGNNSPGTFLIKDWGCYMVSATMLIKYSGINVTPVEVNNWLATKNWANSFNQSRVTQYPGSTFNANGSSTSFSASTLKWNIDNGNPIIVRVTNHFMVIKGYNNSGTVMSDFIVSNPALSYDTNLSYYNGNTTQPVGTYTKILEYYFFDNFIQTSAINQSLPIYAGSITTPKELKLVIEDPQYSFNINQISEIKITSSSGIVKIISNLAIKGHEQFSVANPDGSYKYWRLIKILPVSSELNGFSNGRGYKISFKLTQGSTVKTYQNNDVYFEDFYNATSLQDLSDLDNWVATPVRVGASMGLYRGPSPTQFNPSENLTRAQAAAVLVNLGVRLRLLNIVTTGTQFADVSSSHPFFNQIQTLRNYGHISANTSFNPENFITVGEFCKMIANVLNIQSSDYAPANYLNYLGRKITVSSINGELADAMNKLLKIVDITDTNGFWITNNAWDFFDFSSISQTSNIYTVTGTAYVSRAKMAKVLLNLANWKSKKSGISLQKNTALNSISSLNDIVSLGEKYDNASITATSTPITPTQQTYSCASGGSVTISYNPGSLPQHYYWSMQKNGATLTSNNSAHSSVTFTAPTVSVPTQWKLYTYTANNKGKAKDTYITINVGGSSGGSNAAPTQQAHSLLLYGESTNSISASWTRGNGQNCIVTCKQVGANPQAAPSSGVVYTGNSNFNSAPAVFNGSDTKVIYTGTGSSVNITGLNPNTKYQIAVYEYNSTTPSTVQYNLNNATVSTTSTSNNSSNPPIANVLWDYSTPLQVGQAYLFSNASNHANSYQWSITNGAIITNPTSSNSTYITFNNTGLHVLTLIATNTSTGQSNTQSYNINVNSAADLLTDLQPANLDIPSQFTGGNPLNISVQVKNNSSLSPITSSNVLFVLSTDQTFDVNDHFLGSQTYTINPNQTITVNHIANNISNTLSGTYYLIAIVDYSSSHINGDIDESNEQNNVIVKQINLQQTYVDFVAHSLTAPSLVNPNNGFSVSGTFQNIGNRHADFNPKTDFVISTDQVFSNDDYQITGLISNYSPWGIQTANGPIVSGSTNLTIPSSVPNGNYYLIARINNCIGGGCATSSDIPELNQINNYKAIPIQVVHPYEPTISASNFSITNITNNSLRLIWTRGNGESCIVIGLDNSMQTVDAMTKDDISYTPNNNFVSAPLLNGFLLNYSTNIQNHNYAKVLYDGNGSFVDIVGLQEGKTYTFSVVEYNNVNGYKDYKQFNENIVSIQAYIPQSNTNAFIKLIGNSTFTGNQSPFSFFKNSLDGIYFNQNRGLNITNDGGVTWKRLANNVKGDWATSKYIDNNFIYIGTSTGRIIKINKNNFNDFSTINISGQVTSIYFNNNNGYACSTNGKLYKTTNNGLTWVENNAFSQPIMSSYFIDIMTGWITLGNSNTSSPNIKVLKTSDGGNTWSQYSVPHTNIGGYISDIYFFNPSDGSAVSSRGWLLKTTNGGVTWSQENIFGSLVTSENYDKFPKINFLNNSVGYINFRNQKLAKTIDGGNTWQVLDVQNIADRWMGDLQILSENEVFLFGEGGILKTITGGLSNSITLNLSSQNSYCTNQSIVLPYTTSGIYASDNIFTVELSDSTGNFSNPTSLNTFTNAGSGTINVSIPQNIAVGNGYKFRIIGSNPSIISNVTSAFAITASPQATITITPTNSTICPNQSITFTATPTNGGTAPSYTWKKNGVVVGSNSDTYTANNLTNGDIVWAEMASNQPCASTVPVVSTPTAIQVTQMDELFIQAIENILAASTDVGVQWIRNGQPIAGATSQFYEAKQTGFYQFSVTINGCTVLSDIYNLTSILSTIENLISSKNFKLYPNPFKDELFLSSDNQTIKEINIYDLSGKLVKSISNINARSYRLDAGYLISGNYLVSIKTENGLETYKVIKK